MEYKFIKIDKKEDSLILEKHECDLIDELRGSDKSKYNRIIRSYFNTQKDKTSFLNRIDELFEIYRNRHIYELVPFPRKNISHAIKIVTAIQEEYHDPLTDIRAYLSKEGLLILNFLSDKYKDRSPKEFAIMVYVLNNLKWLRYNNLSAFFRVAKPLFGEIGTHENLRATLGKLDTSVDDEELIKKTTTLFKEELGKTMAVINLNVLGKI